MLWPHSNGPELVLALWGLLRLLDDDVALNDGFEWGLFLATAFGTRHSRKEVRKRTVLFPEVHGCQDEVWERTQEAASLFDDDPNERCSRFRGQEHLHSAYVPLRSALHGVAHDRVARGRPGAGFTHSGGGVAVAREGEVDPPEFPLHGSRCPSPHREGIATRAKGGELFCGEHPRG